MIRTERNGSVTTVIIDRRAAKNAVDRDTAEALAAAFRAFDEDTNAKVAVLAGDHGTFCAGADLKALAAGRPNRVAPDGDGPMGPSRMLLGKPVIAAISGHAVAGGLELALWCDLRVADEDAILGVFCRRFGVPLIDGGTIRLPRLIGLSRALDLILTGRAVTAQEALSFGLVNRVVPTGTSLAAAQQLAAELAALPQGALRADRTSAYLQHDLDLPAALLQETQLGATALAEAVQGAARFTAGAGRHRELDVIKGLVLGIAIAASIAACATTGPRGRDGNKLTGTCAGVCDHYIECKSGHPEADRSRCIQECPEVFRDDDSRVGYESLTCEDAVEYVDGSQKSART